MPDGLKKPFQKSPVVMGAKFNFPPHDPPGAYPGAYWYHTDGQFAASVTAHDLTNDKKDKHRHITIKTARDLTKNPNMDRSRVHVTYGQDVAQFQVTDYCQAVFYKAPYIKDEKGRWRQLVLKADGSVVAVPVDQKNIITAGD